MHSGLLSLCTVNNKKSGIIFMNIEITANIIQAVKAFMVDHPDYNVLQIANEIACDQSTMSRILNGKTKTMNPYTYNRLEYLFIRNYLPKEDLIEYDPDETIKPVIFRNPELDKIRQENKDLKAELKKCKSAIKKTQNFLNLL